MDIKTGNMNGSLRPAGPFEHNPLQVARRFIEDRLRAALRERLLTRSDSGSARPAGRVPLGLTKIGRGCALEGEGQS